MAAHVEATTRAARRLARCNRVMLTCHLGPDGDSLGSMVALASVLTNQRTRVTLYNPDPIPRRYRWMPLARTIVRKLPDKAVFDATIVVDCGDVKLLGKRFPKSEVVGDLIVLDHHASAAPFGDYYVCDPNASCVGVIVWRMFDLLGWSLTADAAIGLYVSLVSDTGSFRYANTNAEALTLAAELVSRHGVQPWTINERLSERVPLAKYRLLAAALGTLELVCDGKIAFMKITKEMITSTGSTWEHTDGIVNYSRSIDGVECGVLLTPAKQGGVRVSLRSKGGMVDAGKVCARFGGGGHRGAAGCIMQGDLPAVRAEVERVLSDVVAPDTTGASRP